MYRKIVTETSPDRNGSDRKVLFRENCAHCVHAGKSVANWRTVLVITT